MEAQELFIPLEERPRPSVLAASLLLLLAVAGLWAASLLLTALPLGSEGAEAFALDALYYLPFILLPVAIYGLRRREIAGSLRLNPMPLTTVLLTALIALMCVYLASAINSLWAALLNALGLQELVPEVPVETSRSLLLAVLHTAAIPAVCEELLCRGVVFSAFESRGTWYGLWMSSVLFGLMHGNVYGLPAYILVGAVSAFIVFCTDSLYAGMFFHTVYNTAILVILNRIAAQPELAEAAAEVSTPMALSIALDVLMIGAALVLGLMALNLRRRRMALDPVPRRHQRFTAGERAALIALIAVLAVTNILVQIL